jgi:allantoin racemase
LDATKKFRIWAQGATDQIGHRNYLAKLLPHMKACTDADFELEFKTMTPSVTTVHALSEFRFSRAVVRGAIQAEQEGYDVFFMNHFQDVGLYEARAAVKMPVLGLGEATLLHACTMGRKLGLLAINPAFIPTHNDQIVRYGLQQRIADVRAIEASINDYMEAFASPAKKLELQAVFERCHRADRRHSDDAVRQRAGRQRGWRSNRQRRDGGDQGRRNGRQAEAPRRAGCEPHPAVRLCAAVGPDAR